MASLHQTTCYLFSGASLLTLATLEGCVWWVFCAEVPPKGSSDRDVLSNGSKGNERCNYFLQLAFSQVTCLTFSNEEQARGPVAGQVTGEAEKHTEENRWAGRVWTDSGDFFNACQRGRAGVVWKP